MEKLGVVRAARGILAKVSFPHEALVYSAMLKSALDAALAMILVFPTVANFDAAWTVKMIGFPIALLACLALGWGLGLLFLPISALYSDVSRAIQLALRFGFFLTPVIFMMPTAGIGRRVMLLNPVTPLIVSGRAWLAGSDGALALAFIIVLTISITLIVFGLVFYKVALPQLIERLSG
jgi:lipopolysaccharide transport system permease protein